jgi:hypothetical protein
MEFLVIFFDNFGLGLLGGFIVGFSYLVCP